MRLGPCVAIVTVWLVGVVGPATVMAQDHDVAVVVNEKNATTSLSSAEVRKLFAGEKHSWPGGVSVKVFVRAPGAHERVVLLKILRMSESEYKRYWALQLFRGEVQTEPFALSSNGMQREAIVAFPGAVALVNFQDVKPGMKVVKVGGRLPGEAGYPLN